MKEKGKHLILVDQKNKPTSGREIVELLKKRGAPIGKKKDDRGTDT